MHGSLRSGSSVKGWDLRQRLTSLECISELQAGPALCVCDLCHQKGPGFDNAVLFVLLRFLVIVF